MGIKDKRVLITGASRGIGEAIARRIADKEAKLFLTSRTISKNSSLLNYLNDKKIEYYYFDTNLANMSEIKNMYDFFMSKTDGIDVLINNAGRGIYKPITEETAETIKEIIDLNLTGLIYTTALFSKSLIKNKGTIINIASVAGRKGFMGLSTYCASKWGVVGFSESIRDELCSKNVRVITIEPGLVDTDWDEELPDGFVQYKNSVDMLKPEDIAKTIEFVLEQPDNVSLNEILIRPTNQPR
jgi:NADP-dependent 3-hydroxy acid dehydrogenase YdfG